MAKAIYCLKIDLFRGEFTLTKKEKIGIRDICIFLAKLYLKVWIQSPMAAKAPQLDLEFFKNQNAYREVDKKISRIAINKLCNHLWYLAPETAALAFLTMKFDLTARNGWSKHWIKSIPARAV